MTVLDACPNPTAYTTAAGRSVYDYYVVDKAGVRLAQLVRAKASQPLPDVLDGIATGSIVVPFTDPGIYALFTSDGKLATTENAGIYVQVWVNGRCRRWYVVANPDASSVSDWAVTLNVASSEQELQWRVFGGANRRNLADLDNWDPNADTSGKFDASLTGWTASECTVEAVTAPVLDPAAPYTAAVTAPSGGVVDPYCGLIRSVDVSHDFAGGIPHRLTAWNWTPVGGTGSGMWYGAALRARYVPPSTLLDPDEGWVVCVVQDDYARGRWNRLVTPDLQVPANTGGSVEMVLMPAEANPDNTGGPDTTYWSRFSLIRDETFTAVNYERGDKVNGAVARIPAYLAIGEDNYRGIVGSGADLDSPDGEIHFESTSPPDGEQRIQYRYEEVGHPNAWDTALEMARHGNCNVWVDHGANQRVLRCQTRGTVRWDYPLGVDSPRGYLTSWSPDASKARNREIVQSSDGDWSRAEGSAFAELTGAIVDEVFTAPDGTIDLYQTAGQRVAARAGTPQIVQASLPGDADVQPGDWLPIDVEVAPGQRWYGLVRLTSVALDEEHDRVLIEATDMIEPS